MDSNTNDPDPEIPPDVPSEQLEEALKWLEDLAGRPDVAPEANAAVAPTDSSPFHGLIDNDADDLPDWLNETPPPPVDQSLVDGEEFESRLDWLAKMAERESMEELPTLEWRRISDAAAQQATAGGAPLSEEPDTPPLSEEYPEWPRIPDTAAEETTVEGVLLSDEPDTLPLPEEYLAERFPVAETPAEPVIVEAILPTPDAAEARPAAVLAENEGEPWLEELPAAEPEAAVPDLTEAAIGPETLLDSLPPDVELPPIDDLDDAMAWIEELAASQDAPIEDVPSVADRALASKLLREAGISPDSLDLRRTDNEMSLGDLSLLEGNTPVNAFVAEEDFADTIVLMETMAADQGRTLEEPTPAEPAAAPPEANDASFDEAMAFLDELAAAQEPLGSITQPIEPIEATAAPDEDAPDDFVMETVDEATAEEWAQPEWLTEPAEPDEEGTPTLVEAEPAQSAGPYEWSLAGSTEESQPETLLPTEAPWLEPLTNEEPPAPAEVEEAAETPTDTAVPATMDTMNNDQATTLEETLLALDALALPAGTSLDNIDASLRQSGRPPARRNLSAAVEWLELSLGISGPLPAAPLSDEDLIARMPEDPDAVLAWLEQMAEEDTVDSSPSLSAEEDGATAAGMGTVTSRDAGTSGDAGTEPFSEELSEVDLLGMPDDPDAIIAWLEGLSGEDLGSQPRPAGASSDTPVPPAEAKTPAEEMGIEEMGIEEMGIEEMGVEEMGVEEMTTPAVDTEPSAAIPFEAALDVSPEADLVATTPDQWPRETEAAVTATAEVMPEEAAPPAEVSTPLATDTTTGASLMPVPAQPRRRGRARKVAVGPVIVESESKPTPPAGEMMAQGTAGAVEAADEIIAPDEVTAVEAEPATVPEDEAPPPPAKPASWVDLLKPLR